MVGPANTLHGLARWTLAVLVLGHATMAIVHQVLMWDGTPSRMAGRPQQ